jgi:hypothetical protein
MNEPFLPLPLPSPPEHGIGRAVAGAVVVLSRRARTLIRAFRRIDIREPLSRGDFHPHPGECFEREWVGRERERVGRGRGRERPRFPVLPPVEL